MNVCCRRLLSSSFIGRRAFCCGLISRPNTLSSRSKWLLSRSCPRASIVSLPPPCRLHTTSRLSVPQGVPFVVLAVVGRRIMKFAAAIFGRAFRKWYNSLPADKRRLISQWYLRNRRRLIGIGTGFGCVSMVYYLSHLTRTPITGRRKFVAITHDQHLKIAQLAFEQQLEAYENKILPAHDLTVLQVKSIANRLLDGNRDIKEIHDKDWQVYVVNEPVKNAFVVPTGQIFFFTGMMDSLENEDQLGIILAHEMAHTVLGHGAETLSHARLLDWLLIVSLGAIWALMPSDGIAAVASWFYNFTVTTVLELPYSRKLELEADAVGLEMAAKACFDVRESYAYWANQSLMSKIGAEPAEIPSTLSTHPNHGDRAERLDVLIPKAIELRKECNCDPLRHRDPRAIADIRTKLVDQQLAVAGRI